MDDALAGKIKKIHAMIEGATTPGEAEAAAAAFQRVLMRHNVSVEEARALGTDDPDEIVRIETRIWPDGRPGVTWRISLVHVLAQFHLCRSYRVGIHGGRMILLGTKANIDAVRRMFDLLSTTYDRLAVTGFEAKAEQYRQLRRTYSALEMPKRRTWTDSFLLGACSGLYDKLHEERAKEVSTMAGVSALVTTTDARLWEAEQTMIGHVVKGPKDPVRDGSGFRSGYDAARNHDIREAVGGGFTALPEGGE